MSAETATAGDAPPKLKIPLLVGMVAVGLGLGMAAGVTLVGPTIAKKMGKVVAPAAAAHDSTEAAAGEHAAAGDGEHGGEEGAPAAAAEVLLVENLVLNPAGSGGGRFLLFSVGMEVATPAALASIKERDAELRDLILTHIGAKTLDQLTEVTARDSLKLELETALSERFGKKSVRKLYFPQFVIQ